MLDKCEREVVADARRRRLEELDCLTPPAPGTFQIGGQTVTIDQAWADVEFQRYIIAERHRLTNQSAEWLAMNNAHVHAALMEWRCRHGRAAQ